MIMNKYFCGIALFLFFIFSLQSFSYEFKVLGKKGSVQIKKGKADWSDASIGEEISKTDKIQLKDGYLGLVHSTGKTLEITKAGTYTASKLAEQVKSRKSKVSKKFTDYVASELSNNDDMLAKKNYKANMDKTGAVERAAGGDVNAGESITSLTGSNKKLVSGINSAVDFAFGNNDEYINAICPKTSYVMDKVIDFSWNKHKKASKYTFHILDVNNKEIFAKEVQDTSLSLDLATVGLSRSTNYFWYVNSGKYKSDQNGIYWLSEVQQSSIKSEIEDITGNDDDLDAITYVVLALYYEDENIMNRAMDCYKKAIKIAPIDSYKKTYSRFLQRLGLADMAKVAVK